MNNKKMGFNQDLKFPQIYIKQNLIKIFLIIYSQVSY